MKLFKGETGDTSIVMLVWAEDITQAISMCNKEYEDDGSGFEFDDESVEEITQPDTPGVAHVYSFEF